MRDRLAAAAASDTGEAVYDPARLTDLPEPVRRYLAFALTPGQAFVRRASLAHRGEFALRPGAWRPFTSHQEVTGDPPGFVWEARMAMGPWPATVRVRDSYVAGVGATDAALATVVPLGGQRGTPEVAASALWRYLAEAVWLPTALLPSDRLSWTAIDARTARATLRDRGATATADFHFGAEGQVDRVTGMRYRAVGRGQRLTPTEGWHRAYRRIAGMMVPTEGEVAWLLPAGPHAYWRATIVDVRYEPDGPSSGGS